MANFFSRITEEDVAVGGHGGKRIGCHNGSHPLSDMAREAFVALLAENQEDLDSRSTWTDVQRLIEFDRQF